MTTNTKININANERAVLTALDEATSGQDMCVSFSYLADEGRTIKDVRRACRALRRKGLAEFHRGLMNDDGEVAGSGYCISPAGEAFLNPCDICGGRISYDYIIDAAGKHDWEKGYDEKTGRHIRECNEHYKQSAERPQQKTL